jgi:two-component system, chemotaxis family, chemotaxis protein CheY
MPGLDGFQALQQIREADPTSFVAIVSAGSSLDNVRKALALGAGGFVVKPYKPQRILDVLKKYEMASGHKLLG